MWILILATIASITNAQAPANPAPQTLVVTHKLPDFGDLKRKTFEQQVIQLALEKTQKKVGAFEMVPVNVISRTHAIAALSQNLYENFVMVLSYEDVLGSVNTNKCVCDQSKLDEKFKNYIQFVKA